MTSKVLSTNIGVATVALAIGYTLTPWRVWSWLFVAVGALWLFGSRRNWRWIGSFSLVLFVGGAGVGLWAGLAAGSLVGLRAGWMLLGTVAALSAWDLNHFARRLAYIQHVEDRSELERQHLRRLLLVDGLSVSLASIPLAVSTEFGLSIALLLGLLVIGSLSRVVSFMRRESD